MLNICRSAIKLARCDGLHLLYKAAFNDTKVNKIYNSNVQFFPKVGLSSNVNESIVEDNSIDFEAITNGDAELEHKLKVILLETEVMRQEGRNVPENIYMRTDHWQELLKLPTRTARRKYLEFLFKISKKKENKQAKKEQKKIEWEQRKPEIEKCESIEEFAMKYDLQHNNLFLRIYDTTINNFYNNRLIQAIQFGQKIVIDCGYESNMTKRENTNCAKQLMLLFSENRCHDDPYDLHFCNFNFNDHLMHCFQKHIPTIHEPSFPINLHEKSYLEVFPKEKLVYLTPHCREEMEEYDHDAIYIIGGLVDKINNEPLSLAKAKKEGLKMVKLPLDKYLHWGSGSGKSLTLNQVTAILLDIKKTGDWQYALRHVPRRKIIDQGIAASINKASDRVRSDSFNRKKKWVPVSNIKFNQLTYNRSNRENSEDEEKSKATKSRERIVKVKSIFNE